MRTLNAEAILAIWFGIPLVFPVVGALLHFLFGVPMFWAWYMFYLLYGIALGTPVLLGALWGVRTALIWRRQKIAELMAEFEEQSRRGDQ